MTPETETQPEGLPSTEAFLADFGIESRPKEDQVTRAQAQTAVRNAGLSTELGDLLIQYCAACTYAFSLAEVKWGDLAKRLGTPAAYLQEAAEMIDSGGQLWDAVLGQRIKRATASKVFRDSSWERLESLAVNRLVTLAEKNMIRDPGELLAVASHARRANENKQPGPGQGGNNVTINFGGESMDENGLPAAGAKMTIDLTPRVASALSQKAAPSVAPGSRVIDGKMLSAQELREALVNQKQGPAIVTDMFNEGEGT